MRSRVSTAAFALATFIFFTFLFAQQVLAQEVFTVAGGYVGDGKPATSAAVGFPQFAAFDLHGNLLISDEVNCRIRMVDKQGTISTIAGTGICGFSGDGGRAIHAKMITPTGLAVDPAGNVFFADVDTSRVRKIDPTGTITTIAGNGSRKYCGDGNLAVKACLSSPSQLAIGRGKAGEVLYIADTFNQRIRQVVLSTGIITTVAGNGTIGYSGDGGPATKASLSFPSGVGFYALSHTLWIADTANAALRQVDLKTGVITTFLGDGTCSFMPLTLCNPMGLTTDASGNVHVADNGTGQVLKISVPGKSVSLDAGVVGAGFNGDGIPATSALFLGPTDVVLDSNGDVLTVDSGNARIRKGSGSQNIMTVAGGYLGDGKLATSAAFDSLTNLAFDNSGNLYVADFDYRIREVMPSGKISTFAGDGFSGYSGDGGPAKKASLNQPFGVATDNSGNVFIADTSNSVVRKVDTSNTISTFASIPMAQSMTTDSSGNLYVADGLPNCVIWRITPDGTPSIVAGTAQHCGFGGDGGPATQAFLNRPFGVALDSAGNFYIGDSHNQRVRFVDSSGTIHTVAGNGTCGFSGDGGPGTSAMLCEPRGLTLDAKGNLYIADLLNFRVRILNTAGIIQTLAGTGKFGYNGNGLPALKTNMAPYSVAVSPGGELYILDVANSRVRKIQ